LKQTLLILDCATAITCILDALLNEKISTFYSEWIVYFLGDFLVCYTLFVYNILVANNCLECTLNVRMYPT
jgi:hypothetical protein